MKQNKDASAEAERKGEIMGGLKDFFGLAKWWKLPANRQKVIDFLSPILLKEISGVDQAIIRKQVRSDLAAMFTANLKDELRIKLTAEAKAFDPAVAVAMQGICDKADKIIDAYSATWAA